MSVASGAAVLIATLGLRQISAAETDNWIRDGVSGCGTSNPFPSPDESIKWYGQCKDGRLYGTGTLIWYRGVEETERNEGMFKDGELDGSAITTYPDGHIIIGQYSQGRRNGTFVTIKPDSAHVRAVYQAGKLVSQNRMSPEDVAEWRRQRAAQSGLPVSAFETQAPPKQAPQVVQRPSQAVLPTPMVAAQAPQAALAAPVAAAPVAVGTASSVAGTAYGTASQTAAAVTPPSGWKQAPAPVVLRPPPPAPAVFANPTPLARASKPPPPVIVGSGRVVGDPSNAGGALRPTPLVAPSARPAQRRASPSATELARLYAGTGQTPVAPYATAYAAPAVATPWPQVQAQQPPQPVPPVAVIPATPPVPAPSAVPAYAPTPAPPPPSGTPITSSADADAAFARAYGMERAGQFYDAEQLYERIMVEQPSAASALLANARLTELHRRSLDKSVRIGTGRPAPTRESRVVAVNEPSPPTTTGEPTRRVRNPSLVTNSPDIGRTACTLDDLYEDGAFWCGLVTRDEGSHFLMEVRRIELPGFGNIGIRRSPCTGNTFINWFSRGTVIRVPKKCLTLQG